MSLSNSTNYTTNRDQLITRALRICSEVGTGDPVSPDRLAECALVLNDIFKEWEALGMQLWKRATIPVPLVASTGSYTIGLGSAVSTIAPLKVLQAWTTLTSSGADIPVTLITKQEYDDWSNKTQDGSVTQAYYNPPGATNNELQGTLYVLDRPSIDFAANNTLSLTGIFPMQDFDQASDTPDIPSYMFNALVWALVEQLAPEAGVPLAERSMFSKMADKHLGRALSFDIEEGSLYIQPDWQMFDEKV